VTALNRMFMKQRGMELSEGFQKAAESGNAAFLLFLFWVVLLISLFLFADPGMLLSKS
jgi:hypothetical protein